MGQRTLTPTEVDMVAVVRELAAATGRVCESNGWYSGATTGDAPLYVVRRGVTAVSRRLDGVGRRSDGLQSGSRKIPAVHPDLSHRPGLSQARLCGSSTTAPRRDDALSLFFCFPEGPCQGGVRALYIVHRLYLHRNNDITAPSSSAPHTATPPLWSLRSSSAGRRSRRRRPSSPN
jgi:hypothetical protein